MTTLQDRVEATPADDALSGRAGRLLTWAAAAVCGAGLLAGVVSGPLWLDETLSVEIARLPLPEMFEALRRDGSPPLYYLLLHAWMAAFGTGTVAVRLLTVLMVPVALLLAHRVGGRLAGAAGARAAFVVLAALPWTMRFGSETRMYLLVVCLVLAGTLALLRVWATSSRAAVVALAACVAALLLTHYWSLYLLAAVGLLHLPGLVRREPPALRVAAAGALGGLAFLPWLPTLLFQAAHTGAPWAGPPGFLELLRTPRYWGGGSTAERTLLALVLVALAVWAVRRSPARAVLRPMVAVVGGTLGLAWTQTAFMGGAYTGRYTAVVVPLFALAVALGAAALPRRWPVVALALVVLVGGVSGVRATTVPRTSAQEIADTFRAEAARDDVLVYCPDQLGPPVARLVGDGYRQVVYPTLAPPQRVDWVDYAQRNEAASPAAVAGQLDELARGRQLFVLKASEYRTFGDDCDELLSELAQLRGPGEHLFGNLGTTAQQLFRFE